MNIKKSDVIKDEAIKNLLFAQKRIAENGEVKSVIRITRYLLNLTDKVKDIVVEVGTENMNYRLREIVGKRTDEKTAKGISNAIKAPL